MGTDGDSASRDDLSFARTPGAWPTRWPTRRGPQGRREGCRRIVASQVLTCMAVSRFPCCTGRRGSARLWWTASMAALCGRGRGAHASRPGRGRHSRPLCTPPGRQQPHRPDARCLPRSMRARVDHVPAIGPFHSFVGRSTIILTGARGSCQAQECPARRESILPGASTSQFSYRQKNLQPADRLFCWHSMGMGVAGGGGGCSSSPVERAGAPRPFSSSHRPTRVTRCAASPLADGLRAARGAAGGLPESRHGALPPPGAAMRRAAVAESVGAGRRPPAVEHGVCAPSPPPPLHGAPARPPPRAS